MIETTRDEEGEVRFVKLTPQGVVTGSLIGPLMALTALEWAALSVDLHSASEEALLERPETVLWPLGRVLELLGFTVER